MSDSGKYHIVIGSKVTFKRGSSSLCSIVEFEPTEWIKDSHIPDRDKEVKRYDINSTDHKKLIEELILIPKEINREEVPEILEYLEDIINMKDISDDNKDIFNDRIEVVLKSQETIHLLKIVEKWKAIRQSFERNISSGDINH